MVLQVTSELFTLYAVNIATAGDVDGLIAQIQNTSLDAGNNEIVVGGDGSVYRTFAALMSQQSVFTFTTTMCATAIGLAGPTGLKISSDEDDDGFELWFQSITEGGTRGGAGTNVKCTINEGILIPISMSVSHGGIAQITYALQITYDGTNDPVVIETDKDLEGTPAVSELFTAGPLNINGTNIESIQDINVNFGISPILAGGDGTVWNTFAAIMEINPSATFSSTKIDLVLSTFGLTGLAQNDTDSIFFFTKIEEGALRIANNVAEHISFTVDEGRHSWSNVSAGQGAPANAGIQMTPTWDGTNAPFVIDTTAAIA